MNSQQSALPMPNPGDWVTLLGAAERLGRSERTIRRWITQRKLTGYTPVVGHGEEAHTMLWLAEVDELNRALHTLKIRPGKRLPTGA